MQSNGFEGRAEGKSAFTALRERCGRNLFSRRKLATAAAALLALGVGYHVIFGAHGLTVYEGKLREAAALNEQLQTLQGENARLKEHVARMQSDPDAIEHEAREQLRYTRPGEVIYTLPIAPQSDVSEGSEASGGR
jgi:cell division protein FtsB